MWDQIGDSVTGWNPHLRVVVIVAVSFAIAKLAQWTLRKGSSQLGRRAHAELGEAIVSLASRPVFSTILLSGVGTALAILQPRQPFMFIAAGLIKTLLILTWLTFSLRLAKLILQWMTRKARFEMVQPVTLPLFEIAANLVLVGGAVYFILVSWQVDVTGWIASAGVIGIAVGFAAKDTLANLFAGVFIIADRPYRVGDVIVLDQGERGRVTRIGLRSTRIVTRDDLEITIPNSIIANSRIVNESRPAFRQRIHIPVAVGYGADVDAVKELLRQAASANPKVCRDPEPRARLISFESALSFELLCWIENPIERGQVRDELTTAIYKAIVAAGIEIPYPKQEIYIKEVPASAKPAPPESQDKLREFQE